MTLLYIAIIIPLAFAILAAVMGTREARRDATPPRHRPSSVGSNAHDKETMIQIGLAGAQREVGGR